MSQQDQDQSQQRKLQLKMEMQMEPKSRWSQSQLATNRWHCCCRIKHIYKMQIANAEHRPGKASCISILENYSLSCAVLVARYL